MDIKEHVKQYANRELCAKWNNNIPISELGYPLQFLWDYQDIAAICEAFTFLPRQDITGILVSVGDGDYSEVYVTESSNPYMLTAIYHPLEYYL